MLLTQRTDSAWTPELLQSAEQSASFCVHLRLKNSVEIPAQARAAARFARSNSFMNATSDSTAARGQAL